MTIAELHGKISSSGANLHERLEDLLTSDVFGTLLYAEAWDVLSRWLARGVNVDGGRLGEEISFEAGPPAQVQMAFWPQGGALGREPDVVLRLDFAGGTRYGLCVEAKYLSPKSNFAAEHQEQQEPGDTPAIPTGDQLADQWKQITAARVPREYGWACVSPENRALLFVTAHVEFPYAALEESLAALGAGGETARKRCFWVGWCELCEILRMDHDEQPPLGICGHPALLYHLFELLDRKGLRSFQGFSRWAEPVAGGLCKGVTSIFWRARFWDVVAMRAVSLPPRVFWREP